MKRQVVLGCVLGVSLVFKGDVSDYEQHMNRLAKEKSPYLLQHADNPVDWYPWGEEAFEAAREQDKPIFLSIGYSTCHWCHVMEHESFEDPDVAQLMNRYFINIKVDREERPDIDNIYMTVCQIMTGSGGWPLTILMTPERKPFFAGTYFPKETISNRPGMMDLIPAVGEMWGHDRDRLLTSANTVVEHLESYVSPRGTENLDEGILREAFSQLLQRFDDRYGGLQGRMKFPTAHTLSFLLRYWKRTGDPAALHMVEKTLQEMRRGGVYDHVGLGFHRYATDPRWRVPHFEKMLYDQAINAIAYLEAYQATGKHEYARTADEIFRYVLREMTSPDGGFYSAEDADSEGEEGRFYVWTRQEITDGLGHEDGEFFMDVFNIRQEGNTGEESPGQPPGRNIPYLSAPAEELAGRYGLSESEFLDKVEILRQRLFRFREHRVHPLKDDKILTDWNGLMIAAMSKGARVLEEGRYRKAAEDAARFALDHLRRSDGKLLKRFRNGVASLPAHLEDYAFLVWGLLELYETTFDPAYLRNAVELTGTMIDLFWDEERGGFFFTGGDRRDLLVRTKDLYDGAIPSGNSVAAMNLFKLGRLTANPEWERKGWTIGTVFSDLIRQSPTGYTQFLSALDFGFGPSYEVVIVGNPDGDDTRRMIKAVRENFVPDKVVILKPLNGEREWIEKLAPFTEAQGVIDGKATVYVCQNYTCKAPTTDPGVVVASLR